jgi:hypothetical protein
MSNATQYRKSPQFSMIEIPTGLTGAWLVTAQHMGAGRRYVLTATCETGDDALSMAKSMCESINPFATDGWAYTVEFYDTDISVATSFAEIDPDMPIEFQLTKKEIAELRHEEAERVEESTALYQPA